MGVRNGGISEWACLADDEKKELRKAKWAREIGSFFLPRTIFFACPPGIAIATAWILLMRRILKIAKVRVL